MHLKVGQAYRAADLVSFQDAAVISREILQKKSGTVTMFAFDAGQGLSEHTAPFEAMVWAAEGEAEIRIANEPHILRRGEILIMPAGIPHSLRAVTRFQMMLVMIKESA